MIFSMTVIGAVTRLTLSGVSITEWEPLAGVIPPLSDTDWQRAFSLYQQIPQFRITFGGSMSIDQFKGIYYWEWFHRLWGRLIGVVFTVPLLWFCLHKRLPSRLLYQLSGVLLLGGLQGAAGWFMVASGLVDRTSVSPYRLAIHLILAVLIYGWLVWMVLNLLYPRRETVILPRDSLRCLVWTVIVLLLVTMVWGAFVAGLDAGIGYNTWPLMNDYFLPPEAWDLNPILLNLLENNPLVQFIHRWLGTLTALMTIWIWIKIRNNPELAGQITLLAWSAAVASVVQVALGVSTLLYLVPVPLAATHQASSLILFTILLWLAFELRKQPIRNALPN
jgi:cytochrome c oxidase assembly protein subunit 15